MIYSLYVSKELPGVYSGRICHGAGSEPIVDFTCDSISEVILEAAAMEMTDAVGFHIWYQGLCLGTVHCSEMLSSPEALAQRAMDLTALFWE